MKPKKIKLNKEDEKLVIDWTDGRTFEYPLRFLRDESPDAGNKGETILWKHYDPPPPGPDKPGKYEIADIKPVGNYAIQITWKDGYNYGLYSWDLLIKWGEYFEVRSNILNDPGDDDHDHHDHNH